MSNFFFHLEHPKESQKLSQCFNQMTEELAGTQLLRADFVRNFSHEFKTPIVSILGVAKLLKNQELEPAQSQEYLDIIIEESQRLSQLSATILNLSKVESLSLLTDKTVCCLSEQIREAILLLEHKWVKKQIEFEIHMEEMDITANASLLKQVWVNLLDNAVKFSPAGESVFVTLQKEGGDAVFAVRDNGPGMDEKTKPFF